MTATDSRPVRLGQRVLDWDEARRLYGTPNPDTGKPWSYQDIADMYGVTKQAVGKALRDPKKLPYQQVAESRLLPWTVDKQKHGGSYFTICLRAISRRERGEKLTSDMAGRVAQFEAGLKAMGSDLVIYYDRVTAIGYHIRPRRRDDVVLHGVMVEFP